MQEFVRGMTPVLKQGQRSYGDNTTLQYKNNLVAACLDCISEEIFKMFINIAKEVFKGSLLKYAIKLLSINYLSGAISMILTSTLLEVFTFSGSSSAAG